jgi:hypothetical protein
LLICFVSVSFTLQPLYPWERALDTQWGKGWMGSTAGLDLTPVVQPVDTCFTVRPILAHYTSTVKSENKSNKLKVGKILCPGYKISCFESKRLNYYTVQRMKVKLPSA